MCWGHHKDLPLLQCQRMMPGYAAGTTICQGRMLQRFPLTGALSWAGLALISSLTRAGCALGAH